MVTNYSGLLTMVTRRVHAQRKMGALRLLEGGANDLWLALRLRSRAIVLLLGALPLEPAPSRSQAGVLPLITNLPCFVFFSPPA